MKPNNRLRVAICQPHIILGGRLHVILAITRVLNEIGIIPDILTFGIKFDPLDLTRHYGPPVQLNFKLIKPRPINLSPDISIMLFNLALNIFGKDYDLLINSSNSAIFLPEGRRVLHYFHFPREKRLVEKPPSLHHPKTKPAQLFMNSLLRKLLKEVYRLSRLHTSHVVVCNSEFTRNALLEVFSRINSKNLIIYPPVDLSASDGKSKDRKLGVVSVGRFEPAKRQFEQIQIAEQMPHIPFHITGFLGDKDYFRLCTEYVRRKQLMNVSFHPDVKHEEMLSLLAQAKYFLHTLINEPFGITVVQSIGAGCLPIVHDSGGQKETVPEAILRYEELDQAADILKYAESLEGGETSTLQSCLLDHARRNFDVSVFHEKMKNLLTSTLAMN